MPFNINILRFLNLSSNEDVDRRVLQILQNNIQMSAFFVISANQQTPFYNRLINQYLSIIIR